MRRTVNMQRSTAHPPLSTRRHLGAFSFIWRAPMRSPGVDRDREVIQCLDAADWLAPQYIRPELALGVADTLVTAQRKGPRREFVAAGGPTIPLR
jgi:hypothetical protein